MDNFQRLYLNGTLTYKCLALFKQQKILDSIFLQKEILERTVDVRNRLQRPFFCFLSFSDVLLVKKIVFAGIKREQTKSGNTVESTCLVQTNNANCFHRQKQEILTPTKLIKQLLINTADDVITPSDGYVPNYSRI